MRGGGGYFYVRVVRNDVSDSLISYGSSLHDSLKSSDFLQQELFTLFKIVYQIKYYNDIIRNLLKLIYSKLYKSINNVLYISFHLISLSKCDFFSSVLCLWTVIQTVPFVKMNGIKCEMCTYNRGRIRIKNQLNDTEGSEKYFHSLYFHKRN